MSEELRVVLLGKTGVGKSSTGNTILGREAFKVSRGLGSGTERCQWADDHVDGVYVQVTDTPGLCDTHREEEDVLKEVGKSVAVARPGPHVVLMVIRCDNRFTQEEFQAYLTLKKLFGEGIKNHLIIVFVGIDALGGSTLEAQRKKLDEQMKKSTGNIATVLEDASNRYIGVYNMASTADRAKQAADLLRMMQGLVKKNGGKYFRSKLSDDVNELVKPLVGKKVKKGKPQSQAEREINEDIVSEEVEPGFLEKLTNLMSNHILPLLKTVTQVVVAGATLYNTARQCSLM